MSETAEQFRKRYGDKLESWRQRMAAFRAAGRRVVVWGAGSKGVTFLNMLEIGYRFVPFVVDVNPRKRGMFVPDTGQQVVDPGFLREYRPEVVLVMNPVYQREIAGMLDEMGVRAEVLTV